jgi:hypothetical protein
VVCCGGSGSRERREEVFAVCYGDVGEEGVEQWEKVGDVCVHVD